MIEFKNVSFRYGMRESQNGLSDINLKIENGEIVLLTGESGCGKTTLTRLINGLIPNYYEGELKGEVLIDGKNVSQAPLYETAKIVGSVFQNPRSQFFNVDTTSELAFGCENMGISVERIERRIEKTVNDFQIEKLMGRSIFNLSGGEKQKIACASVSASKPMIYVLDEPSSNLDIKAIDDLKNCIERWKNKGKTIIIAEHRLYFLRKLADRIIYMKDGKIEREFSSEEMSKLSNFQLEEMGLRPFKINQGCFKGNICNSSEALVAKKFSFAYKHQPQILCIDEMSIPKNSVAAVIGHNGAGKSTFARCFCGLEKHCKGEVCINDCTTKCKKQLKNCYMVMQDVNHQLFTESILDEVLLSMDDENKEKAEEILKSLDLYDMKDLHPMSLSGGQKQRVAIASAIASEKQVIIFDEPTSGLDLRHMKEVANIISQLSSFGKTIIVITHDLELIKECCNYVIHFENGNIIDSYSLDSVGQEKISDFFAIV